MYYYSVVYTVITIAVYNSCKKNTVNITTAVDYYITLPIIAIAIAVVSSIGHNIKAHSLYTLT